MNRTNRAALIFLVLLVISGCRPTTEEPVKKVTYTNSNRVNPATSVESQSLPSTPGAGGLTLGGSAQYSATPAAITASAPYPFRLSTGIALPQTGVDGTLMSFSIDYQVAVESLDKSSRFALVVSRANGNRFEQTVGFDPSGSWSVVINRWSPEDGPFAAFVDEITTSGDRHRVSLTIPLE